MAEDYTLAEHGSFIAFKSKNNNETNNLANLANATHVSFLEKTQPKVHGSTAEPECDSKNIYF